jgi:hypothetical protein
MLASVGLTDPAIAILLGLDLWVIRDHFDEELELGRILAEAQCLTAMNAKAAGGNVAAIIWWMSRLDAVAERDGRR